MMQAQAILNERVRQDLQRVEDQLALLELDGEHTAARELLRENLRELLFLSPWLRSRRLLGCIPLLRKLSKPLLARSALVRGKVLHCFFRLHWSIVRDHRQALTRELALQCEELLRRLGTSAGTGRGFEQDAGALSSLLSFLRPAAGSAVIAEPKAEALADTGAGAVNFAVEVLALQRSVVAEPDLDERVQDELDRLTGALIACIETSDWLLDSFARGPMAGLCRKLVQLSRFSDKPELEKSIRLLEFTLIGMHLVDRPPAAAALSGVLQYLSELQLRQRAGPALLNRPTPAAEPSPSDGMQQRGDEELARMIHTMHRMIDILTGAGLETAPRGAALLQQIHCTETILLHLYKCRWVLDALQREKACALVGCYYRVCEQHWYLKQPLPEKYLLLLREVLALSGLIDTDVPQYSAGKLMSGVLALWPVSEAGRTLVPITPRERELRALSMQELPEYLSTSFSTLLAVQQTWMAQRAVHAAHEENLRNELHLLEQGAAALRLHSLEEFACVLCDVYHLLDLAADSVAWPGELLWRAHRHLIAMLDRAAAWLYPFSDDELTLALGTWLDQADEWLRHLAGNPAAGAGERYARLYIIAFLRQASGLLGRSVRGSVALHCPVPDQVLRPLLRGCREMLRWMLLQGDTDLETRRRQLKPLAINVRVDVEADAAGRFQLILFDDSCGVLPNARQLRRVKKAAGLAQGEIGCEAVAGEGRIFRFFSPDSDHV